MLSQWDPAGGDWGARGAGSIPGRETELRPGGGPKGLGGEVGAMGQFCYFALFVIHLAPQAPPQGFR